MLTHPCFPRVRKRRKGLERVQNLSKSGISVELKPNIFDHFSHFYPFTLSISERGSKSRKFWNHLLMNLAARKQDGTNVLRLACAYPSTSKIGSISMTRTVFKTNKRKEKDREGVRDIRRSDIKLYIHSVYNFIAHLMWRAVNRK
jgi:hypothetical protein